MAARLAYANLLTVSGVTITASASETGYPVSNLSSPAVWRKWRSTTTTGDQWVKFDLGSSQTFQMLAGIYPRIHTGGTLHAQANATDSWGSPTVNVELTQPSPDLTGVWATWLSIAQSLRWVRFYFTNTGAVSTYVELGGVFTGPYLEPTVSLAPGVGIRRIDPSIQRRAIGGQRSSIVRPKYHEIAGTFQVQSASARDDLRTAFHTNGATTPAVFSLTPGTAGLTFYGAMTAELQTMHRARSSNYWDVPFGFVEDVP